MMHLLLPVSIITTSREVHMMAVGAHITASGLQWLQRCRGTDAVRLGPQLGVAVAPEA